MIRENDVGSKLPAALEYHEMGLSIVPLVVGRKFPPRGFKLKRYFDERPKHSDLQRWFRGADFDMGVCLGEVSDGLCLRDFDCMPSYERWATHHSRLSTILPTTVTGRDGGGRHAFFTADVNDIRERSRSGRGASIKLDDGGHLKGNGIAVLPPSTHRSGRQYRWLNPPDDFPYVGNLEAAGLLPPETSWGFTQDIGGIGGESPAGGISNGNGCAFALSSPVLAAGESPVDWAVRTTLPTEVGQRHEKLFDFIRRLRAIPDFQTTDPGELRLQVCYWHNEALPNIRTKDFEETWIDFLEGWDKVDVPFGARIEIATQQAQGTGIEYLESLCRELQKLWGDNPFFLSTRMAGELAGVSNVTAAKWFDRLIQQGKLELVEKGKFGGRKASSYLYTE